MTIALNLLYLLPGTVGGTETYALSLIRGLSEIAGDSKYLVLLNRESEAIELPNDARFSRLVLPFQARRRWLRYLWEQVVVPPLLTRYKVRLIHSLGYVGPLGPRVPHVLTLHDLNFRDIAESVPPLRRFVLGAMATGVARRADHVITVSKYSKTRIEGELKVPGAKISVVYHGPRELSSYALTSEPVVQKRYRIHRPYIIAFSSRFPHKNIPRLIEAYGRIAQLTHANLVIVGHVGSNVSEAFERLPLAIRERVRMLGFVPEGDVVPLLRGANLFVFPSRYEGFGLPLIDAQAAGVPVVCSNAGALPEIAEDAAEYFDPNSTESICAAMMRVLANESLSSELIRRGYRNVQRFSWRRAAEETRKIYCDLLDDGSSL